MVRETTIAKIFARGLNCEKSEDGNPCNQCSSCMIIQGTNLILLRLMASIIQ